MEAVLVPAAVAEVGVVDAWRHLPQLVPRPIDARLVPLPDMQGATALEAAGEPDGVEAGASATQAISQGGSLSTSDAESGGLRSLLYVTAPTDTYTQFFEGYHAGGGTDEERIDAMIQCESTWRIDPGGYFLGLAQFEVGTWATVSSWTGYADPYNPYDQGWNVAVWASMVSPGTSAGWPNCWWAW